MQDNMFDKTLHDKLKGYEAEFNPAHWQQMEKMLKKEKGFPLFLFAFLFGVMAVGGLLIGMEESVQSRQNNEWAMREAAVASVSSQMNETSENREAMLPERIEKNSSVSSVNHEVVLIENAKAETTTTRLSAEENKSLEKNVFENKTERESKSSETLTTAGKPAQTEKQTAEIKSQQTNQNVNQETRVNQSPAQNAQKTTADATAFQQPATHVYETKKKENAVVSLFQKELLNNGNVAVRYFSFGKIGDDLFAENEGNNLPLENPLSENSEEEKSLARNRKNIFSFRLGMGAGMTNSFISAAYQTKPGFTVDVSQDLMFINRIGLSLTQGYTVLNYDGGRFPQPENLPVIVPNAYTSKVQSFVFGASVRANMLNRTRWTWYAKAGVQHFVKLKETFAYQYPHFDTIPANPSQSYVPQTSNNFSGNIGNEAMFDGSLSGVERFAGPDITLSGAKRYHAAFHFATGFDVRLNSRLSLQFEAGHAFTRPAVGSENKRLHSMGVNGRLMMLFGK